MKEFWQDIKGYEGYYQISSFGRIKSLSRIVKRPKNGQWITKNRILKQSTTCGYKTIKLLKNRIKAGFLVHRLAGKAFIDNPENKPEINHKDGIRHHNNIENLEWVTKIENERHAWDILGKTPTKYWLGKKGKNHHSSLKIRQSLNNITIKIWDSISDAHRSGYNKGHICECCKGSRHSHKGYNWDYNAKY